MGEGLEFGTLGFGSVSLIHRDSLGDDTDVYLRQTRVIMR